LVIRLPRFSEKVPLRSATLVIVARAAGSHDVVEIPVLREPITGSHYINGEKIWIDMASMLEQSKLLASATPIAPPLDAWRAQFAGSTIGGTTFSVLS
jgi:hypothetical protein